MGIRATKKFSVVWFSFGGRTIATCNFICHNNTIQRTKKVQQKKLCCYCFSSFELASPVSETRRREEELPDKRHPIRTIGLFAIAAAKVKKEGEKEWKILFTLILTRFWRSRECRMETQFFLSGWMQKLIIAYNEVNGKNEPRRECRDRKRWGNGKLLLLFWRTLSEWKVFRFYFFCFLLILFVTSFEFGRTKKYFHFAGITFSILCLHICAF